MQWRQRQYRNILMLVDALSLLFALIVAVALKQERFVFPKTVADFSYIGLNVVIWFLIAHQTRLYRNRISKKFPEEILYNVYTNILFVVFISSFLFLTKSHYGELFQFIEFISIHFSTSITIKYIIRKRQHSVYYEGGQFDRVVMVGYNRSAQEFAKTLLENPYYGYKCVGFIHDTVIDDNDIAPYLGRLDHLATIIEQQMVDEVVISQENNGKQLTKQCIDICDQFNIPVRIMPALQDLMHRTEEVDNLGLLSVINLNQLPLDKEENKIFKEVFDKLFAILFFLVIGWWLFPIVIVLIKLTSKGKIFYKQERWGLNNQPIICYKFRTMYEPEKEMPFEQTSKNDPRVTPIGKWFRKLSIDELPQFWNVLKGDMSVVGPRPHPTPMNIESMHRVANYMKRHVVKPGITGWAQINGRRGEVRSQEEMEDRVSFDLYYIHRWNFTLDIQIILQTIIKMLRDKGAY